MLAWCDGCGASVQSRPQFRRCDHPPSGTVAPLLAAATDYQTIDEQMQPRSALHLYSQLHYLASSSNFDGLSVKLVYRLSPFECFSRSLLLYLLVLAYGQAGCYYYDS